MTQSTSIISITAAVIITAAFLFIKANLPKWRIEAAKRVAARKAKAKEILKLIETYNSIKRGHSLLSNNGRRKVITEVESLIANGTIRMKK